MNKEFEERFCTKYSGKGNGLLWNADGDEPEIIWAWIEEEIKQARIDECKRSIDIFMSMPTTDYSDLMLKHINENRIKELEKL